MTAGLYLLTVAIWGTTWIALKWQLGEVAPLASIAYRFALAALVLFVGLWLSGKLQRLRWSDQRWCMVQGLCLFCLNFLCFYTATQWIASGLVAVIFSTASVWNALAAKVVHGRPLSSRVLLAGALGVAGLGLLLAPQWQASSFTAQSALGVLLACLGTLCFSVGNLVSAHQQANGIRPLTSNAWGMLYGTVLLVLIGLLAQVPFTLEWTPRYLGALFYLAIPGSVIGFTAYLTLVGRLGPERAAYCTVLFPVVALNISAWLEGYSWTLWGGLGLLLVLAGNLCMFARWPAALRLQTKAPA